MCVIAFDEAHSETWTIDREKACELNKLCPEYHYFGHAARLASDSVRATVSRLTDPWTDETLSGVTILVLMHPCSPSKERTCGGSPIFKPADIARIVQFVEGGGGLFVVGEWSSSAWGSNINSVLVQFGLTFSDDTLRAVRSGTNAHLLSRHFTCSRICRHPATEGVTQISYHRGCAVNCGMQAEPLIWAPGGQPVFAVSEHGAGRVAAVGDSDLFSVPFIGHYDNAKLLANTMAWLGQRKLIRCTDEACAPWSQFKSQSHNLRPARHEQDLGKQAGEHLLDCSAYAGELESLCCDRSLPNPYDQPEEFLSEAELCFHDLPREMRQRIIRFKRYGNQNGVLLLRGLPSDPHLPVTPADSRRSREKYTFRSEFWLAAVAGGLGDAIGYAQEKEGEIVQNICPTKHNADKLSSESSTILLDFHTETAFHPFMPDFLMLYCLRPDHERMAQTIFASTRHMIPLLPLKYRALLFEDAFQTGIDYSFGSQSGVKGNGPVMAVLYGDPYDPFMKYDLDLMKGCDPEADQALKEMQIAANAAKDFVYLDTGDLVIIDNRRTVHGRSNFTPRYDGMDRWLQRVFVVRDLAYAEEDRQRFERVIETEFVV